ncbi:hypothetical protein BGZ95_000323, partial [Linnemannia exigua]
MDGPSPQKRSRHLTINNHTATTMPLTPLSADVATSPMLGMTSFAAAGQQAMYMDSQHYRQQQQQQSATTVQSMTPDQFSGNGFDWMTVASAAAAAASASELNGGGLATPGNVMYSAYKHLLDSTATAESCSNMPPTPTLASTAAVKAEQSSPVLSASTCSASTTSSVVAPIIPSSTSVKSARRRRTKGPMDPSVNTTPIPTHTTQFVGNGLHSSQVPPTPVHPFGGVIASATTTPLESKNNPFESTTPTPQQQHQFHTSVVLPSQHFHKHPQHQQYQHHALATPTSATVPTPPLPLPSSNHQYLQQQQLQQQNDFGGSHGLGLGLNLNFYDFMPSMSMPPAVSSASSPASSASPSTPNSTIHPALAHSIVTATQQQSPVNTPTTTNVPSPIPKTSGLYTMGGSGSVLQSDESSSSSPSSPSMMDLTGMASGLVDAVVVASQTSAGSLKRNSSHLTSNTNGSNKLFTSRGSFSSSSQGNSSSAQTSPDLNASHSAPLPSSNRFDRHGHHGIGLRDIEMDFEHDDRDEANTSTINDDDDHLAHDDEEDDDDSDDPENNSPAICPHCLKEFQSKGLLRSHIVSHSSDRPFVCRDCSDKSYKRNHDLLRHRREKHNVEGAVIPPRGSGRHSHSGASGTKRGSGIGMVGMGDMSMMGGLVGFVSNTGAGGVRNRSHRRSCSSAILGSGLGTRSTTTTVSSPFSAHPHVNTHQGMGMGLPEGYATAVMVSSQNHPHQQQQQQQQQHQQSKIPSPHDLMFASPAAAAGMMFLGSTTNNLLPGAGAGGNGLEFPHLASMGGAPTPSFTLP